MAPLPIGLSFLPACSCRETASHWADYRRSARLEEQQKWRQERRPAFCPVQCGGGGGGSKTTGSLVAEAVEHFPICWLGFRTNACLANTQSCSTWVLAFITVLVALDDILDLLILMECAGRKCGRQRRIWWWYTFWEATQNVYMCRSTSEYTLSEEENVSSTPGINVSEVTRVD
jgi:hypothetical protein